MLLENTFLHIKWPSDSDRDFISHTRFKQLFAGVQHKQTHGDTKIPLDTYRTTIESMTVLRKGPERHPAGRLCSFSTSKALLSRVADRATPGQGKRKHEDGTCEPKVAHLKPPTQRTDY